MPRNKIHFSRYVGGYVGRSIEQYVRSKQKEDEYKRVTKEGVYDKWSQAINSCHELVEGALKVSTSATTTVIPVLVIPDDCLWVIDYDDEGRQVAANTASHCEVHVNAPVGETGFRLTHLEVWTFSAIAERVKSVEG